MLHLLYLLRTTSLSWADFIVIERYTMLIGRQATYIIAQIQQLLRSAIDLQKALRLLALPKSSVSKSMQIRFNTKRPILEAQEITFAYSGKGR